MLSSYLKHKHYRFAVDLLIYFLICFFNYSVFRVAKSSSFMFLLVADGSKSLCSFLASLPVKLVAQQQITVSAVKLVSAQESCFA